MILMILRKSVKSIQLRLNELLSTLPLPLVSASAFCQARLKLKHTAFIELNKTAVVEVCYGDETYLTHLGWRILSIDGSRIRLPNEDDIIAQFGTIESTDGQSDTVQGEHCYAQASVLYDVLNKVAIDAQCAPAKTYEGDLARDHLNHVGPHDLTILDRGDGDYAILASFSLRQSHYLIRCSASAFATARQMLKGEGADSQVVTIKPGAKQRKKVSELGLATKLKVRFVRVLLDTGEYEVLVTSLLDEPTYPTALFKDLYWMRWGVEGFYGLLKTRLDLDHFTGKSAESVKQDFYSSVYLTGLESLLIDDAQQQLDLKPTKYPQRVNNAMAFNAIKNQAFDMLLSDMPIDDVLEQLTQLFLTNPTCERKHRNVPRTQPSSSRLIDFYKRRRKICF